MAEVTLDRVTKRFDAVEAVADLSLTISDGEFVVLLGPTGAGKTTTLRLVAGLEQPDAGDVSIGRRVVTNEPPAAQTRKHRLIAQRDALETRRHRHVHRSPSLRR